MEFSFKEYIIIVLCSICYFAINLIIIWCLQKRNNKAIMEFEEEVHIKKRKIQSLQGYLKNYQEKKNIAEENARIIERKNIENFLIYQKKIKDLFIELRSEKLEDVIVDHNTIQLILEKLEDFKKKVY